jgi:hypothetical protein
VTSTEEKKQWLKEAWRQYPNLRDYMQRPLVPLSCRPDNMPLPTTSNPFWDVVSMLPYFEHGGEWGPMTQFGAYGYDRPDVHNGKVDRFTLCGYYSHSIISPGDIAWIKDTLQGRSVVEFAAGAGYWAWQLDQAGINVMAYDIDPLPKDNPWVNVTENWFDVWYGTAAALLNHSHRALMIVWPRYGASDAVEAVRHYYGDMIIFAGEDEYGCTGDDDFFSTLEREWVEIGESPYHPTWEGIHCRLRAYRRKHQ